MKYIRSFILVVATRSVGVGGLLTPSSLPSHACQRSALHVSIDNQPQQQKQALQYSQQHQKCDDTKRDEELLTSQENQVSSTTSTSRPPLAHRVRQDFAILDRVVTDKKIPLVYLDSGATSHKPKQVIEALEDYYTRLNSNVHRGAHCLSREATDAYETARGKVASFVNAFSRNEIVFTSGATEAINLVVQSYGRAFLQKGDEIVLTVFEHHSNLVPWQMLAQERGVVLKFVHVDPQTGGLDMAELTSHLSKKTRVVTFQHVSNVLGCINPVKEIVSKVRKQCPEAIVLLDACQSVPHMAVDVQDLGVDFVAASGHKMCAPTGIGFLWGREELLNEMPPWKGGGEMIDQVTLETVTWQQAPARFEAGTPAIAQAIGLGAAIDYLQQIGMKEIEAYEHELAEYLYVSLQAIPGITILGPKDATKRAALCAFWHESVHPSDLSSFLDMDGVAIRAGHHCCQPLHHELGISHSARASLSFYNTKEDIDSFVKSLKATINFFDEIKDSGRGNDDDFVPFV